MTFDRPSGATCGGSPLLRRTKEPKKTKNMDLNAYVLAMAVSRVASYQEDRQVIPEPEFKPFDLRYLRDLSVNSNQPRQNGRDEQSQRDVCEAIAA